MRLFGPSAVAPCWVIPPLAEGKTHTHTKTEMERGREGGREREREMFPTDPYVLNVTAVNPLGAASEFFLVYLDQIIQPDPPENVTVSPIQGKIKTLLVRWEAPSSWLYPEYFPLQYIIRYSRDGSRLSRTVSAGTRPIERTSFNLTGIRSGVTYHIQVAAKDFLDNGEYSAWSLPASGPNLGKR
uniref:Fibronectin type-III domain-containing protein n=1 Tax=Naja naja TaxID=35670 RepID=A0A8C6XLU3_NAJNA